MVLVDGSLIISKLLHAQKYHWKSLDKTTIHKGYYRKAILRVRSSALVNKVNRINKKYRKINIKFSNQLGNEWILDINRVTKGGNLLQTYLGVGSCLQVNLNRYIPEDIWTEYHKNVTKSFTKTVKVRVDLAQWSDAALTPKDFLPNVEFLPKQLIDVAINKGLKAEFVPKGRAYDLDLIGPYGTRFILAMSSYTGSNNHRSKEKRKQKILGDIAKMLTVLDKYNYTPTPVVISEPLEFKGSWSLTTDSYLNFYKEKFNFTFLTTEFKKGWESDVCNNLLKIDRYGRL